jgi:formylglycine-generating enzyme required for sulfatase activity
LIPETSFLMGSENGADNERPVHRVWVDAFEIGVCPVTNAEYAEFLSATGRLPPPLWGDSNFNHAEQPVVAVSWVDAMRFCEWLGERYRLPSEAEWECAARGGVEGMLYPWGNELPADDGSRWRNGPERVGQSRPNAYGLYDMCENVHEWCADWYAADFYAHSPERNPRGPESGSRRSSRGGSWRHQVKFSRCAARSSIPPQVQYADYGFRVARDVR